MNHRRAGDLGAAGPVHAHGRPHLGRLAAVLVLTAGYAVAELAGGLISNSLALLADAGHMLTDVMALGLALFAAWSARRPPDTHRTYGYRRAEILAALVNGMTLLAIAAFIALEAWERFRDPPQVDSSLMALVGFGGLVVNLVGTALLHHHQTSLNVRGAYLHLLGDLLSSIGVLIGAGLIAGFGWRWADPLISVAIAGVIVFGAVRLVLDASHVLMEGAPAHLDAREIQARLGAVPGVGGVHDMHLWSLGGDHPLLTAHLVLDHSEPAARVLRAATTLLRESFAIEHATLQIEPPDFNIRLSNPGEPESGRSVR